MVVLCCVTLTLVKLARFLLVHSCAAAVTDFNSCKNSSKVTSLVSSNICSMMAVLFSALTADVLDLHNFSARTSSLLNDDMAILRTSVSAPRMVLNVLYMAITTLMFSCRSAHDHVRRTQEMNASIVLTNRLGKICENWIKERGNDRHGGLFGGIRTSHL